MSQKVFGTGSDAARADRNTKSKAAGSTSDPLLPAAPEGSHPLDAQAELDKKNKEEEDGCLVM